MLSVCSVPAETDEHSDRLWMVCLKSSLNTSRKTSSSCPRFNLASDCTRSPVPTSWFLPHAGLHLATEHSQSQELEHGTHCRLVSPPHHLCPHSGDSWRHFFSSDNSVNNTNYCVVVLKCSALSTTLILANWTELNWTLWNWKWLWLALYEFFFCRFCFVLLSFGNQTQSLVKC